MCITIFPKKKLTWATLSFVYHQKILDGSKMNKSTQNFKKKLKLTACNFISKFRLVVSHVFAGNLIWSPFRLNKNKKIVEQNNLVQIFDFQPIIFQFSQLLSCKVENFLKKLSQFLYNSSILSLFTITNTLRISLLFFFSS